MLTVHTSGNIGNVRFNNTQAGKAVLNFSVASSERWTNAKGEAQERTTWITYVVWGERAVAIGKFIEKVKSVVATGKLMPARVYQRQGGDWAANLEAELGDTFEVTAWKADSKQSNEQPPVEDGNIPF